MPSLDLQDRAAGALMGAFIGDALALGPHWYYDLAAMRADYGDWISGYTDPRPERYHGGMKAGQASQAGILMALTVDSLVSQGGYDEADFCRRLDEDFFPQIDGTPMAGPGGYTSQSMREAWRKRVLEGLPWGRCAGNADTTEAAERIIAIAVRHALRPERLADAVTRNTLLTQNDGTVVAMTVAFAAVLGLLVEGQPMDGKVSGLLMARVKSGLLPFHTVTSGRLQAPRPGEAEAPVAGRFPSPDALLGPSSMALAATDPGIRIEPAWKVSTVYGMPCAVYHQFPAAYYLAARFPDDFESAVLHAVNGGGQNLARAMLTGALAGAQTGLSGIPQRFIDGLENAAGLLEQARRLADQMAAEA
ncbi:ADP-ribosylglycohydrolase family protein [Zoogloea dura]|jgi:ADP-ribosylglycohydrolase|uniref:ADP-ribosylglycohydrolase family protein n=1 Tax=Zoogloea dura TaxID=2728840 RepID=A0A848GCP4_9RHOO|nr:ADP-ribosylglycohydrolase family protein [Zoogloea dura]NML27261.1 ADP-ribosylglycohydrolase family protein [Zoogloea dura]